MMNITTKLSKVRALWGAVMAIALALTGMVTISAMDASAAAPCAVIAGQPYKSGTNVKYSVGLRCNSSNSGYNSFAAIGQRQGTISWANMVYQNGGGNQTFTVYFLRAIATNKSTYRTFADPLYGINVSSPGVSISK